MQGNEFGVSENKINQNKTRLKEPVKRFKLYVRQILKEISFLFEADFTLSRQGTQFKWVEATMGWWWWGGVGEGS